MATGGLLYSQGTSAGGVAGDIVVWDVHASKEVTTLPTKATVLHGL